MDKWLIEPGLPKNKAALCAVSGAPAAEGVRKALAEMEIQVISVPAHEKLAKPCASHPDMLLFHMGGDAVVVGSFPDRKSVV